MKMDEMHLQERPFEWRTHELTISRTKVVDHQADWKPIDDNTPRGVPLRVGKWRADYGNQIEWKADVQKLPHLWRFFACRQVDWTHWDYCPEPPTSEG